MLFVLGFYRFLRFALIDENGGFFLTRLKKNANPVIVGVRRKWCGHTISLPGRHLQEVVGDLSREIIDVTVEIEFKRQQYAEKQSSDTMEFRVVGVRNEEVVSHFSFEVPIIICGLRYLTEQSNVPIARILFQRYSRYEMANQGD